MPRSYAAWLSRKTEAERECVTRRARRPSSGGEPQSRRALTTPAGPSFHIPLHGWRAHNPRRQLRAQPLGSYLWGLGPSPYCDPKRLRAHTEMRWRSPSATADRKAMERPSGVLRSRSGLSSTFTRQPCLWIRSMMATPKTSRTTRCNCQPPRLNPAPSSRMCFNAPLH